MTEVLFYLSVGFVGYVVYVFVDEQRALNPKFVEEPVLIAKPSKTKTSRKIVAAMKPKSVTTQLEETNAEPADPTTVAILSYLGKNGLTTIAKLARELPESRKMIEDSVDRLIQKDAITLTVFRRAKTVALKI